MAKKQKKIKKDSQLTLEAYTYAILQVLQIDMRFNTILQRTEYTSGREWEPWTDAHKLRWLEVQAAHEHPDLKNKNKILEAIYKEAHQNPINPVREYLLNCPDDWITWTLDNNILIDGLVCSPGRLMAEYIDSPIEKKIIADVFDAWLAGCALHGLNPEHNEWSGATICPILVGPQGCGKSRFTAWVGQAAGKEYYNESIIDADDKDNRISLAKTWIWAADEFSGTMKKSKSEKIKNFLSRKEITERLPYAEHTQTRPRLASLIGTDNEAEPLRDKTGNRRFAVIPIENIRLQELQKILPLERLWGGARYLLKIGQTPIVSRLSQGAIASLNNEATEVHPWTELLKKRLKFDEFGFCTFPEVLSSILGVCDADMTIAKSRELGQILRSSEFKSLGVSIGQKKVNGKMSKVLTGCKI